jgi:hypothetical protein
LAGFEVTLIGRFWVTPEAEGSVLFGGGLDVCQPSEARTIANLLSPRVADVSGSHGKGWNPALWDALAATHLPKLDGCFRDGHRGAAETNASLRHPGR